jgi:hypothetical protein
MQPLRAILAIASFAIASAPAVDGVLGEQLARLKKFVETGAP